MAKSNEKKEDEIKGSVAEPLVDEDVEEENKPKAPSKKKSAKKKSEKESGGIKISLAQAIRYAPYERGLKEILVSKYDTQEHTEDEWAKIIAEEITQR